MASKQPVVLITGANTGIGFELAAQLAAKNYHVYLTARSPERGRAALSTLQSRNYPGRLAFLTLDVTDDASIAAAAAQVAKEIGYLDILVQNAAVGRRTQGTTLRDQMRECLDANTTGALLVGDAFVPLLKASTYPLRRMIYVASGAGSIARAMDLSRTRPPNPYGRTVAYSVSKAGMNMVAATHKAELAEVGIKVLVWNPGFTVSELGEFNKVEYGAKPVEEAVKPLVGIIEGKRDDEEHLFLSGEGEVYPW